MNSKLSSDQRIAIVGASGFLGTHLVRALASMTAPGTRFLLAGLTRIPGHDIENSSHDYTLTAGDASCDRFMDDLVQWEPTHVFHLAVFNEAHAAALVRLEAKANQKPACIVAGSIAEYDLSKPTPGPVTEDFWEAASGDYALGKVRARKLLWHHSDSFMQGLTWAVLPQLWGPGDPNPRLWSALAAISHDKPVVMSGDGTNNMPDGFVSTVAEALAWLGLASPLPGSLGPLRLNVAGPVPLTPLAFLRRASVTLQRPLRLMSLDPSELAALETSVGRKLRQPFTTRALRLDLQRLLKTPFTPTYSYIDGIDRTVNYFSSHILPNWGKLESEHEICQMPPNYVRRILTYDN